MVAVQLDVPLSCRPGQAIMKVMYYELLISSILDHFSIVHYKVRCRATSFTLLNEIGDFKLKGDFKLEVSLVWGL